MKLSKEIIEQHKAYVQRILALKLGATNGEVQRQLEHKMGRLPSEGYVAKLIKKVRGEQTARYVTKTKSLVMAQYEDFMREMIAELLGILAQKDLPPQQRLATISKLIEARTLLTKMLLDSGVLDNDRRLDKFKRIHPRDLDADAEIRAGKELPSDAQDATAKILLRDVDAFLLGTPELAPAVAEEKFEKPADQAEPEKPQEPNPETVKRNELLQKEKELGMLRRAERRLWPDQAKSYPLEERIKNFRETFGQGESAEPWDIDWRKNKGLPGPPPL